MHVSIPREGQSVNDDISSINQGDAPQKRTSASELLSGLDLQEDYRQTFFKAQLNAVLKNHNKPQLRKEIPEWSQLERRLRSSALSINIIGALRDDFNNGWKTWDHSAFSVLPQALQRNSRKQAKINSEPILPVPFKSHSTSIGVARPLHKLNDKPQTKKLKRSKVQEDDYDSADNEWTAAKTVSILIETPHLEASPLPPSYLTC